MLGLGLTEIAILASIAPLFGWPALLLGAGFWLFGRLAFRADFLP
jgi:hypothetical protein